MNFLSIILTGLQAAIAARAARDRAATVLLVAVWGRIARMRSRLERLIALWRAGTLPTPRPARGRLTRTAARQKIRFPNGAAWLQLRMREAGAFGSQLQHALSDAECTAFLAAVPQAGRILRPLFHMLGVNPVPMAVRKPARPPGDAAPASPVTTTVTAIPPVPDVIFSGA